MENTVKAKALWKRRCKALDRMLVAYRTGSNRMPEWVLKDLAATKKKLTEMGEM